MEHSHLKFGHETGFILLFGILISVIVWYFDKDAAISDDF
jgi:cbb3-type cytochrome oxidase subunit 3